jgi:hypothetical protein
MAAGSTYTPIQSTTLASGNTGVTFSSIPSTYTDLIIVASVVPSSSINLNYQVGNGSLDTGTNYSYNRLYGDKTTATADRGATTANSLGNWGVATSSSTRTILITHFQNYANTSSHKIFLTSVADSTFDYVGLVTSLWRSNSAIDIIKLNASGNMSAGTVVTLYGIAAA